jgi:WD40 repeat protein
MSIYLRNLKTFEIVAKFDGHSQYVTIIRFIPDTNTFISASKNSEVLLWEIPNELDL